MYRNAAGAAAVAADQFRDGRGAELYPDITGRRLIVGEHNAGQIETGLGAYYWDDVDAYAWERFVPRPR